MNPTPNLTAQKLDADYKCCSYSGYGVLSGYTSGDINTDSLIPDCYGLIGKLPDYAKPWDFDTHSYDVVVVNLGTNGSSYVSKDAEARTPAFISAYVEFLKTLREKNPSAYLICTLGTMGGDLYPSVENAVEQYRTETGDQRIMSYESTLQNQADGIGSDWHPSAVTQQKSAYVLADKICQALGMESDQIGLDMAADAEYRLNIAAEKGGNAASYVGYDKSFWINMVTGGETPDAIEAEIAGVRSKTAEATGWNSTAPRDMTACCRYRFAVRMEAYISAASLMLFPKRRTSPQSSPQSRTMQRLLLSFSWAGKIPTMSHSPTSLW